MSIDPVPKTLDGFDLAAVPSANRPLILELMRRDHIERREDVLPVVGSGSGEARPATTLASEACARGERARFFRATELVAQLPEAREERQPARMESRPAKPGLLVLDELGYLPASKVGAEPLFDAIGTAHGRSSVIATTDLSSEGWKEVLGSERPTGATLDRLTHRRAIVETGKESYRLKEARERRRGPAMVQPATTVDDGSLITA